MTTHTGWAWSEDPLGESLALARVSMDGGDSLLVGRSGKVRGRGGLDEGLLAALRDRVVSAEAELGEPAQLRWRVGEDAALAVEEVGPIEAPLPWAAMEAQGADQWGWEGLSEHAEDQWSRANAGEVFPGVMTPLTWSLTGAALDRGFATPWGRMARGRRFVALFDGYVYFNFGLILELLGNRVGMRTADFLQAVGGPEAQSEAAASESPPSESPPYAGGPPRRAAGGSGRTPPSARYAVPTSQSAAQTAPPRRGAIAEGGAARRSTADRPNYWRLFVNLPFLTWRAAVQRWLPLRWPRERAAARRERARLQVLGVDASDGEILRALRGSAQFSSDFVVFLMQCQTAAFGQVQFLLWLSEAWVGNRALALRLLQGLPNVLTAESNLELWRLAERAAQDAPAAAVIAETPAEQLLAALEADSEASWLADELRAFLAEHGHRTTAELELSTPRWSEEPAPLLATFRDYALHPQQTSLERLHARQVADRKAAEAQARRALTAHPVERWLPARWLFYLLVVRDAQALQPLRENPKYMLMQISLEQRRLYLLLGERWRARGALDTADDVFWLLGGEAQTLARHIDDAAVRGRMRSRVRRRRRQYEQWASQTPPPIRDRRGEPLASALAAAAALVAESGPLRGIAASAGVARGRARVATSPAEGRELVAGEVLVARFTDPGWTPIFPLAAAVVTEIGGMLSHGAVVAREYGIPAVVNVRGATTRIQTGDQLEVDGSAGVVRVL